MPGLQPRYGQLNLFRAGQFHQVPYRVFVSTAVGQEKSILLRAERSIRKKHPRAIMRTVNSELWIFSLSGKEDLPEADGQFGLKEISTGVFLSSTMATNDGSLPAPYYPFIQAVRHLLHICILSSVPDAILLENALLMYHNMMLHTDIYFSTTGDLFFRIYMEKSHRTRVSNKLIPVDTSVYLAPMNIAAVVVDECPPPLNGSLFMSNLALVLGVSEHHQHDASNLKWVKVKLDNGMVVSWPSTYCLVDIEKNSCESAYEDPAVPQVDNIWAKVFRKMSSVTKLSVSDNNSRAPQTGAPVPDVIPPVPSSATQTNGAATVYPTPPDPLTVHLRQSEDLMTPGTGADNWDALDEDLFGDDGVTDADFDFFDRKEDPEIIDEKMSNVEPDAPATVPESAGFEIKSTAVDSTSTQSTIPVPEFDQVKSTQIALDKDTHMGAKKPKESVPAVTLETNDRDSENDEYDDGSRKKRHKSIFAPLSFNSSIKISIDDKYSQGGRYFVSQEVIEGSGSDKSDSDSEQEESVARQPSIGSGSIPPLTTAFMTASTPRDHVLSFDSKSGLKAEDRNTSSSNSDEWLSLLAHPPANETSNANHKLKPNPFLDADDAEEIISTIIDQVMWDNGLFTSMFPEEEQCTGPDKHTLEPIQEAFPEIRALSLQDFLELVTAGQTSGSANGQTSGQNFASGSVNFNSAADDNTDKVDSLRNKSLSTHNSPVTGDVSRQSSTATAQASVIGSPAPSGGRQVDSTKKTGEVMHLPAPLYAFLRSDQPLKARGPILRFWKVFGLAPLYGTKALDVICLSPNGDGVDISLGPFLELLKGCYEDSGMGEMTLPLIGDSKPGIFPIDMSGPLAEKLEKGAEEVASAVTSKYQNDDTTKRLLFIIMNPYDTAQNLCIMIKFLMSIKHRLKGKLQQKVEFEIVPLSFVHKNDQLVMISQHRMTKLAIQAYDRFSFEMPSNGLVSERANPLLLTVRRNTPAFSLAKIPPIKLNFRFTTTPSVNLMDEDTILHMSYAASRDGRWMIVSWCDQWGGKCKISVFDLSQEKGRPRSFEDVCAEVWDMTLALCATEPIKWRIAIIKAGQMEDKEQRAWIALFESTSSDFVSYSYLLQSDIRGSLILTAEPSLFPFGGYQQQKMMENLIEGGAGVQATTPATPQRGLEVDSPEVYGVNVATPTSGTVTSSVDNEKGLNENNTIIDINDDAYGILFRSRVPLPPMSSPDKLKPAIGGMLIRSLTDTEQKYSERQTSPAGTQTGRQMCSEYTILHSTTPPMLTMKILLFQYRQLTSLAQNTGSASSTVQPWHIEAISKVLRILDALN